MLEDKLEEVKRNGNYSVSVTYGDDMGCDDFSDPKEERRLTICASPVGFLGEVRTLWKGSLKNIDSFDVRSQPKEIPNPPERDDYREDGFYAWGAETGMKRFMDRFKS